MQCKQQFRNLLLNIISRAATAALAMAVVFALTVVLSQSAQAQKPATGGIWTEKVLHSFNYTGGDGANPWDSLIFDAAGNLYGTASEGGAYNGGTLFELTPNGRGGWAEQVLYSFGNGTDGNYPVASLIFDAAGNLYGMTPYGGANGAGTVFELMPAAGGGWAEQVLYSFCAQTNCTDGSSPFASLIFDAAGNLYGTTQYGGTTAGGTVFELSPTAGGGWMETVLYSFCAQTNCTDGSSPFASLIFDAAGNLYGTTQYGGTTAYGGTVFELSPTAGGGWMETVLYSFKRNGTDGVVPVASLIFDAAGNLYGTTSGGGSYGGGTVFELTPVAGGGWTEAVLYSFCAQTNCTDGEYPSASPIFDAAGNLYGTTFYGGTSSNCPSPGNPPTCGTVFELTPEAGGGWRENVLHSFNNNGTDGYGAYASLIFDAAGNLYSTTAYGGTYAYGMVFELMHVYPCATCSHSVLREGDALPVEGRDVLEQGGIERP